MAEHWGHIRLIMTAELIDVFDWIPRKRGCWRGKHFQLPIFFLENSVSIPVTLWKCWIVHGSVGIEVKLEPFTWLILIMVLFWELPELISVTSRANMKVSPSFIIDIVPLELLEISDYEWETTCPLATFFIPKTRKTRSTTIKMREQMIPGIFECRSSLLKVKWGR